nr:MAG TPA: protein of unknown function (DUF5606) [Caudoviricetes sp.]
MSIEKIEGEEGLYKIEKLKILYEVKDFKNHIIVKNFDTGERRVYGKK